MDRIHFLNFTVSGAVVLNSRWRSDQRLLGAQTDEPFCFCTCSTSIYRHPTSTLAGTYNNQYMVVDRSKVKLGHSVDDGALTVVEQIPGLVEYSDQTQALRRGNNRSIFSDF